MRSNCARRRGGRAAGGVALGLASMLVASGCGSGVDAVQADAKPTQRPVAASPVALVRSAPDAMAAAPAYSFVQTAHVGPMAPVTVTGAFNTAGDPIADLTSEFSDVGGGGGGEMRLVDGEMYVRQGANATWLHLDGISEQDVGSQDPTSAMDQLKSATDVREIRTEVVNGETLTVYAISLDDYSPTTASQSGDPVGDITLNADGEVSLDESGVPRRMQLTVDAAVFGEATVELTIEPLDQPIEVAKPPADEVG